MEAEQEYSAHKDKRDLSAADRQARHEFSDLVHSVIDLAALVDSMAETTAWLKGEPAAIPPTSRMVRVADFPTSTAPHGGPVRPHLPSRILVAGSVLAVALAGVVVTAPTAAEGPRGFAYVVNNLSNSVTTISVSTGGKTGIDVGKGPAAVAISPDGSQAYVTNSVSVIDTDSKTGRHDSGG